MNKEQQILNSLDSLKEAIKKPEPVKKDKNEKVKSIQTWFSLILSGVAIFVWLSGPFDKLSTKLDKLELDIQEMHFWFWEYMPEYRLPKGMITHPLNDRGGKKEAFIAPIPKPYDQFNCIVPITPNTKDYGIR